MDFPFESPDMNATTIQKPLRYRKGFRSRHAPITLNEHVGRFSKEQHATERKPVGCFPPLNAQPVKRYEHLTGWESGYFMSEATAFAKATGSSRGIPSTSSAWL